MKTIVFDTDDLSLENNNLYYLDQIKKVIPNFKISAFFIPLDVAYFSRLKEFQRKEVIQMLKDRSDWIELIPHGLTHRDAEFLNIKNDDYETIFDAIEHAFKTYELPYVKGFKAPQWLYKPSLVEYLDKKGWWIATDKNQPDQPKTKKSYEYTHSVDEDFSSSDLTEIRLHSHISLPSKNNIIENIGNIIKIPQDYEFKFISEVMK